MYRTARYLAACAVLFLFSAKNLTAAGVPNQLTYQGRMTDSAGSNVPDDLYMMLFQIYDDSVAGAVMWSSGIRGIDVNDGLFNYKLGDSVTIPESLFINDSALWLGIKIGLDPELTPRTRMTSNAYSYHSLRADSSGVSESVYDNSITGAKIVDGTITGADIANATITGAHIQDDAISSADITDAAITGADIAPNSISGTHIQDGGVGSSDVAAEAITSPHILDGTITSTDIADSTITSADVSANTLTGTHIQDGTIKGADITDGNITGADIAANTVGGAHIQNGTITGTDIASGSIINANMATNSISSINIMDGAVNAADIGFSTVGSSHIVNASISVVDFSAAALPAAGWTELPTVSTNSTSPAMLDSFTVVTPGAGTLILQLSGHVFIDADAVSAASVMAWAEIGICDTPNSSSTCGGTYDVFYGQDADDESTVNETMYINLTRLVFVGTAGSKTFFINGAVSSASYALWSYQNPKIIAIFLPGALSVTTSPPIPGTVDEPQQK